MIAESLLGRVIGNCTLQKLLGQGSMGAVYFAQQARPRRQVAVKVLLPVTPLKNQQLMAFLEHFRRTSDKAGSLVHPNIIEYHEYGEQEGLAYIVMPYLRDGSLRKILERERPLAPHIALNYLEQIAAALDYAHEQNVIHSDLKPTNILLARDGHLVLTDFGLLQLSPSINRREPFGLSFPGTPEYMPFEQLLEQKLDERSDQYSLGVVLFEMLTGLTPSRDQINRMIASKKLSEPLPTVRQFRPDVPQAAEQVLSRALSPKPEERYSTVGGFAKAFRTALGSLAEPPKTVKLAETPIAPIPANLVEPEIRRKPAKPPSWIDQFRATRYPGAEPIKTVRLTETPIPPKPANSVPLIDQPTVRLEPQAWGPNTVFSSAMKAAEDYRWDSQWSQAASAYRQALAEFPKDTSAHSGLGFCLMQMQQWQAALDEYEQVLKSDPDSLIAISKSAELYVILNRRAEAHQAYTRLADAYAQAGQHSRAEAARQKCIELALEPEPAKPVVEIPFDIVIQGGDAIGAYLDTVDAHTQPGSPKPEPVASTPNTPVIPINTLSPLMSIAPPVQAPPENVWQALGITGNLPERIPAPKVIEGHATKLILVGEGGMGKSSLLRALHQQAFDPTLELTHGIQVGTLRLPYPNIPNLNLTFYTWDFGGQEIYQATHQLFLTRRSVYLLVWNARQGPEVCRLRFWLDTISTLAPDASILLVATHTDQWQPHIDLPRYQQEYPQLVGQCMVSNKKGVGLDDLKQHIAEIASHTQLVRQPRPYAYDDAAQTLLARPEHSLDRATFLSICSQYNINAKDAITHFSPYLHDLGKILFFADDPLLSNLVVLRPQWISQAVSAILDDSQVKQAGGLLQHRDLPRIWATDADGQPYDPALYPAFLRLMERFDLCYPLEPARPGEFATQSLVPLLLPEQRPISVPQPPRTASTDLARAEIRYTLDFIPAGLMSWLLVRTHRYSQQQHWRSGAHLAYQGQQAHLELDLHRREIQLVAWGTFPYTFFLMLKDTLDTLLGRFQGLRIKREIPCVCQFHQQHPHFHAYDVLESQFRNGETEIVCQQSGRIPLLYLLYGLHAGTTAQVTATVQKTQETLARTSLSEADIQRSLARIEQGQAFIWRNVMREIMHLSTFEMQKELAPCPNLFVLEPESDKAFKLANKLANVTSRAYRLRLLCQCPAGPHTLAGEQGYELRESKEWWKTMSPWLRRLVTVLKTGGSLGKAVGEVFDQVDVERFANQIDLFNEILDDLPAFEAIETVSEVNGGATPPSGQHLEGAALRALAHFLEVADPARRWHGLQRVVMADRTILWVCEQHKHIGIPL